MKPTCFVLMPFADDFKEVFEHAIRPAAEAAGYDCYRADRAFGPSAIISDIIKSIFSSAIIVADISGSNPNVFYELGVAHTIGNKAIVISQRTHQQLPFDLKAYRVIFYRKTIDGIKEDLRSQLDRAFSDFPSWRTQPTNPVQDFRPIHYCVPLEAQAHLEHTLEELKHDLRGLRNENRRNDLRRLILALGQIEFHHLRNLASQEPFSYVRRPPFLDELRKLRSLGLIRNKPDTTIGGIPETGDLKEYLELTELTREVLEEMFRWFSG